MAKRFEDERGVILDLLGAVDSVTSVFSKEGTVRGNHIHRETDQWTYVVKGRLLSVRGSQEPQEIRSDGLRMVYEPMGIPHAWKALEDTLCLVFTKGPRAGENYESDTERLEKPLIT